MEMNSHHNLNEFNDKYHKDHEIDQNIMPDKVKFSLNEYEKILDYMLDGYSLHELIFNEKNEPVNYKFLKINNAFIAISGMKREEIEGKKGSDIAPFSRDILNQINDSSRSGKPLRFEYYNERSKKYFDLSCFWQSLKQFAIVFRNITKQKKAENNEKELKERYRKLIDSLPQKIFLKDCESNYISCNTSFASDLNITPDKIHNKTDFDFFPKELAEKYRKDDKEIITSKKQKIFIESYTRNKITQTVQTIKTPVTDSNGNITGIIGIFRDVTEETKAQTALKESEEKYRSLVDNAPEAIFVIDLKQNGIIIDSNEKLESLCGISKKEIYGKTLEDISPIRQPEGEFSSTLLKKFFSAVENNKKPVFDWDILNISNNNQTPCEVRLVTLSSQNKDLVRGTIIDHSEKKDLENKLRHSERMLTIGQLAGGIAHDFNNQLSGIMGYAELLMKFIDDENLKQFVQGIITSSERAANLTQQLLTFSRKNKNKTTIFDMHKVLVEVVSLLAHTIDKRIKIQQYFKANEATVKGDFTQLQNAILNIGLNARDAMPTGGKLTFETEIIYLDKNYCLTNAKTIKPGNYLKISISDTGYGIEKDIRKHIFEPFFTTKDYGKGTGMGLASAYTTITNHSGTISVYSEIGHGSIFKVFLPTTDAPLAEEAQSIEKYTNTSGKTILLVDDDAILRKLATEMLKDIGYEVITCSNGYDAIEYYKANTKNINLVILDMIMPEINGIDTYKELKKINPEIKTILSSGYNINEEAIEIMKQGVIDFIEKPYRQKDLAKKVYNALK